MLGLFTGARNREENVNLVKSTRSDFQNLPFWEHTILGNLFIKKNSNGGEGKNNGKYPNV